MPQEDGYKNLNPITDTQRAKELGRKSGEARRRRRKEAEELVMRDLVPLSLKVQKKALETYLKTGKGDFAALKAADAVQDREWGKPVPKVEETEKPPELTQEQIDAEVARLQKALRGL
jgi:hypothetical protein